MALAAYRHLLRSTRIAFQGDDRLFSAARHEARKGFDLKCRLSSGSEEAAVGIAHAEEVAKILRQNVVQGQQVDEEGERYRLRIHEDTERGDNDTVKISGMGTLNSGGCCSSR